MKQDNVIHLAEYRDPTDQVTNPTENSLSNELCQAIEELIKKMRESFVQRS